MATSQQKAPAKEVDPIVMLGGALLGAAMIYLLWSRWHTHIATAYAWLRIVQFSPFTILGNMYSGFAGAALVVVGILILFKKKTLSKYGMAAVIVGVLLIAAALVGRYFASWFTFFYGSDKSLIEWSHMTKSSLMANAFTIVVIIIPLAVWTVRRSLMCNPMNHKNYARAKDFTLHSFTDQMANHYPHLKLFRKLNLTAKSINTGKYRMPDTEKQFAIKFDLLDRTKGDDFEVNRVRAAEVFRAQMGRLWTGYNGLSRAELAVMAVLVPRCAALDSEMPQDAFNAAVEVSRGLLRQYWVDSAESYNVAKDTLTLDLTQAKAVIRKYGSSKRVKKFFKMHAYVGTILYSMLLEARALGVLEPADLRWLRVIDRPLWTLIDNCGKTVSFTECAALYSHYLHEVREKRAIERPRIDNAVAGLVDGVSSYKFSDEEIELINKKLKDKAEKAKIEAGLVEIQRLNLIMSCLLIGDDKREIFEVAVLAENGDVVYCQRCRPTVVIDNAAREKFHLSEADVTAMEKLPTTAELRAKLLRVCNGHDIFVFDKKIYSYVDGMDRSASSLNEIKGDSEFDLQGTAVMADLIGEADRQSIQSAVEDAQLVRKLWIDQKKKSLQLEADSARNAND